MKVRPQSDSEVICAWMESPPEMPKSKERAGCSRSVVEVQDTGNGQRRWWMCGLGRYRADF